MAALVWKYSVRLLLLNKLLLFSNWPNSSATWKFFWATLRNNARFRKSLNLYFKFSKPAEIFLVIQSNRLLPSSCSILNWPDFRRLISEEPHLRCFPDNFWLRRMRKILVGSKNRSNKSFVGDKLELLNGDGEKKKSELRPINNRRRPQREPPAWQHVNITLSASRRRQLFGKSHLLKQLSTPKCLTIFDEWKKEEKKTSSWSLRPEEE